ISLANVFAAIRQFLSPKWKAMKQKVQERKDDHKQAKQKKLKQEQEKAKQATEAVEMNIAAEEASDEFDVQYSFEEDGTGQMAFQQEDAKNNTSNQEQTEDQSSDDLDDTA